MGRAQEGVNGIYALRFTIDVSGMKREFDGEVNREGGRWPTDGAAEMRSTALS